MGRALPETAALVAFSAFVLQVAAVVVALVYLQPSGFTETCVDGPNDRAALALVLASAALGGVAFGGTLAATNRHPASATVALVGAALPYVSFFVIYAPGGLGC